MTLEYLAMRWLRFEKACPVALFERSPRGGHGQPDVIGVTRAGYLLEIEVKRSLSDFRANGRKPHIRAHEDRFHLLQEHYASKWPKQYWYLVPPELAKKVEPLVPDWAGLLRGPGRQEVQQIVSMIPAPTNKSSARLTAREMIHLGHCMANQILSLAERVERFRFNDTINGWREWVNWPDGELAEAI